MSPSSVFLDACQRKRTEYTPVWLMRQAGRYMKEYRAIRERVSFLDMCKTPDLSAEVTLQPVEKFGVDAAIIFADILLPLEGMGIDLEFAKEEGPVIHNPIRSDQDIEDLRVIEPREDVPFVLEAIQKVRRTLDGRIPLIGFSGAPFTLASYMIEGGHSRDFVRTKTLMYHNPSGWHLLLGKLVQVVTLYLKAQIEAGAQAIQLFDSWVGCLSSADYESFVLPHSKAIFQGLNQEVPTIHFATNASHLLNLMRAAGGDVIGVDWRTDLNQAWNQLGFDRGIQGNLDPAALFAPPPVLKQRVQSILQSVFHRPGHIFNLGHGILPQTPVENVLALVEWVHELSRR